MQEIVSRVATAAGIGDDVAQNAVGQILSFVQKEGPTGPVAEMMAKIPGASDLVAASSGGGGGGMMGALGGFMGGGGIMGLAGKLSELGLGMDQMQLAGREIFAYAREKAGEDLVGKVAGGIPGLSQFV